MILTKTFVITTVLFQIQLKTFILPDNLCNLKCFYLSFYQYGSAKIEFLYDNRITGKVVNHQITSVTLHDLFVIR